jgi:hypothetical protein
MQYSTVSFQLEQPKFQFSPPSPYILLSSAKSAMRVINQTEIGTDSART